MSATRPFAIVTGASTGIGFELAKRCAKEGYDLLIAADGPPSNRPQHRFGCRPKWNSSGRPSDDRGRR